MKTCLYCGNEIHGHGQLCPICANNPIYQPPVSTVTPEQQAAANGCLTVITIVGLILGGLFVITLGGPVVILVILILCLLNLPTLFRR